MAGRSGTSAIEYTKAPFGPWVVHEPEATGVAATAGPHRTTDHPSISASTMAVRRTGKDWVSLVRDKPPGERRQAIGLLWNGQPGSVRGGFSACLEASAFTSDIGQWAA